MASKIFLVENPNYCKSGIKSYVHLIRKYRLHPTRNGPYSIGRAIHQTGRPFTDKPIGGRVRFHDVMRKQTSDDEFKQVEKDDIQNDAVFFMPMSIGTPARTLNLVLDTASTDFWVRSSELPADTLPEGRGESHTFDPKKSSTFKDIEDSPWKVSYVDGSLVSGTIGTEDITIGRAAFKAQPVQLAKTMSPMFTQFSADGVLGLAFGHINHPQEDIKALAERLNIGDDLEQSAKLFTVKLGSWGDSDLKKPFYTFGSIDEDAVRYCDHDVHHTPIDNSRGYWMFESPSATVGGKAMNRSENKAVVDTDAALTLLDDQTCQAIYDSIPGALYDIESQGFIIPSDVNIGQLPVVQLAVGEKSFVMSKESLMFAEAKPGYVYGGVQSRGSLEFDILGGTFLDGLYAIFYFGSLRFGAVQANAEV
ncbi:aspartic peptidase domain-containing protein [Aspergillus pseudotamarii]|uniref:Aspartic peptidase domain-containing protein n=1 Tax=Aspergillus pseudotamarii TaxID=132259 RepID=A0A5N6SPT4_ASPPS|nr:aspartic peptidase domain-containing protein [Aspergillus pseudotamarii]KAE8136708.1 aspartic peptidase domain-containing protein [Aspergillus pseudotamarii]